MDIRKALAQAGSTIVGGHAYAYMPDSVSVGPNGALVCVIDAGDTVIERVTPPEGIANLFTCDYRVRVRIYAGRADDRGAQEHLDELISPDTARSVWAAIEADTTLGGLADYVVVESASGYGVPDGDPPTALVAELICLVRA